jgi:hypothetical protein
MRPYGTAHVEEFDDEKSALARAKEILSDGRFHTVSLSHGKDETLSAPRLRTRLGL